MHQFSSSFEYLKIFSVGLLFILLGVFVILARRWLHGTRNEALKRMGYDESSLEVSETELKFDLLTTIISGIIFILLGVFLVILSLGFLRF
jgi:NADH:ubiquinone oxidoreductase subunit 3 (subunit A)